MKKLILIISLLTCVKAFGQTTPPPVNPTSVPTMSWYYEPSTHKMFAYRGAVLGWVQLTDSLQVVMMINNLAGGVGANNGLTKTGSNIGLGGTLSTETDIDLAGNLFQLGAGNNNFFIDDSGNEVQIEAGSGFNNSIIDLTDNSATFQISKRIGIGPSIGQGITLNQNNGITINDALNSKGLYYSTHYNFAQSPQQIPDRQYLDSVASAHLTLAGANQTVTQTPTFSNGLTASGGTISNVSPQFVISTTVNGSNQTLTQAGQTFTNNSGTTTYGLNTAGSTNLVTGNPIYYQSILRNYNAPAGNPYDVLNRRSADSLYNSPLILTTISGVNAKTTGSTPLYTVPTGKTLMVTGVYIKCTAASAITTSALADVGVTPGSVYTSTSNGLTLATQAYQYPIGGIQINPTAGQVVNFNVNTAATGTSQIYSVTLTGYLF